MRFGAKAGFRGALCALAVVGAASGAAFAASAGGVAEHHTNWTDFLLRTLNFVLMAAILVKLLKRPMTSFFITRRENIRRSLADLDRRKAEAEERAAEFRGKLAALDAEARRIMAEYVQEGEAEKARILEAATREADYIRAQAELSIRQEMKAARERLQREIADLSVAAAEELLRKNIRPDDHDRLVREFVTKLSEAK